MSKSKINEISESAIRARKMYKVVVSSIARFIEKADKEYKIPAVYVIDCIIQSIIKSEGSSDKSFITRFVRIFPESFGFIFRDCDTKNKVCFHKTFFLFILKLICDFFLRKFVAKSNQSS